MAWQAVCLTEGIVGWGAAAVRSQMRTYYALSWPFLFSNLLQMTFYICNFEACLLYYLARQGGFGEGTWVEALGSGWFSDAPVSSQYI
jgi:hypothetical protein